MAERNHVFSIAQTEIETAGPNPAGTRPRTLKVLVSAFAASPIKGSEFAVGWEWIRAIAKNHSVWAITRESEREEIEDYLRAHPNELTNVSFCFVPWHEPSYSGILLHIAYRIEYVNWQKRCFAKARDLDANVNFDIVHHVNGTGFREPGFLWKLGKPFIWGPILGLTYFRLRFLKSIPIGEAAFLVAKNLTTAWMMYVARRPRQAAFAAARILAGTRQTATMVDLLWKKPSTVISPVTPPEIKENLPTRRNPGAPLRLIWCGSFEPRKALKLLLLSLECLKGDEVQWELIVIGSGRLEDRCRRMACDLGISEHCRFLGRQPRDKALALMQSGHVFVDSSLYEGFPTTVVEAMSLGLPLVGIDHFGFGDAVDDRCGILIPPTDIHSVIVGFAEAIRKLWRDEELRYKMALAAQAAAMYLSWKHKIQIVESIYQDVQRLTYRTT